MDVAALHTCVPLNAELLNSEVYEKQQKTFLSRNIVISAVKKRPTSLKMDTTPSCKLRSLKLVQGMSSIGR